MANELERRAYRVSGRVQGVGFRWWTRRAAQGLGVGGWVRNEADGSVVAHAIGTAAALDAFEDALRRGPPGARVAEVVPVPADGALQESTFRIET